MEKRVLSSVDGCGGARLFSVSDEAAATLATLPSSVQEGIADGFIRFYSKALRLFVDMKMVPFSPLENSVQFAALTHENVVVDIDGYGLVCAFDLSGDCPHLVIKSVKLQGSLNLYRSHRL